MDSKTKVLLYLERNNSIGISSTGKIVSSQKLYRKDSPESSMLSYNSPKYSRTSSPYSKAESGLNLDKFSKNFDNLLFTLSENSKQKAKNHRNFMREENYLVNFLDNLVRKEKNLRREKEDFTENREFKQQAEKLAKIEKVCEKYVKENKAMKTLLAEMTILQVDAKISTSPIKRRQTEVFSATNYVEKYSKKVESLADLNIFKGLLEVDREETTDYNEMIDNSVKTWIKNHSVSGSELIKILCKKIVSEAESRLLSEEGADTLIAEKEEKIVVLEKKIQELMRKGSKPKVNK